MPYRPRSPRARRIGAAAAVAGLGLALLLAGVPTPSAAGQRRDRDREKHSASLRLPATELGEAERVAHALNRLGYGPRPGDTARLAGDALAAWIAKQLAAASVDDGALERRLANVPSVSLGTAELMARYPPPGLLRTLERRLPAELAMDPAARVERDGDVTDAPARILDELTWAKLTRAVHGERQLEAVMTDFWLNHFNVYVGKGQIRWMIGDYERSAIRPHALGRFRDLLGAVARHPAMLFYLDNWLSTGEGRGVDGRELARRGLRHRRAEGLPPGGVQTLILENRGVDTRSFRRDAARRERAVERATPSRRRRPKRGAAVATLRRGLNENYARELLELHTLGVDGGYTQQDIVETARCFTGWSLLSLDVARPFEFVEPMHDRRTKHVLGRTIEAAGIDEGEAVLDLLARHPSTARFVAGKLARRFVADRPPAALVERLAAVFLERDGNIAAVMRALIESPEFWSVEQRRAKVKTPLELVASSIRALDGELSPDAATGDRRELRTMLRALSQPLYGARVPTGYGDEAGAWVSAGAMLQRFRFVGALVAGRFDAVRRPAVASQLDGGSMTELARTVFGDLPAETTMRAARRQAERIRDPSRASRAITVMLLASPEFQRR